MGDNPFDAVQGPKNLESLKVKAKQFSPAKLQEILDAVDAAKAQGELEVHIADGIKSALGFIKDFKEVIL